MGFRKITAAELIKKAAKLEQTKEKAVNIKLFHGGNLRELYEYEETCNMERTLEQNNEILYSFLKEKIMGLSW